MGTGMSGPMWMPSAPPTLGRMLAWHPQPVPVFGLLCVAGGVLYVVGVVRLHRSGTAWPVGRTIAWLAGLLSILAVTQTGLAGYGMETFSAHMVQHMVLSMFSPMLLVLGAPFTLALRTLPSGRSATPHPVWTGGVAVGLLALVAALGAGSPWLLLLGVPVAAALWAFARVADGRGPRERLLSVLHSRFAAVLTHPLFTIPLFVASLYGLYFTPLFDYLMRSWAGHELMLLHFVTVGLLFFWPVMGVDPAPRRSPYVLRVLELFVTMPFHAFFGTAIMSSSALITTAFAHPPAAWGFDPLSDQRAGGGIAWAFSEIPTLFGLLAVFVQWSRSEDRAARRGDRQAVRDDDAETVRYNDYLRSLAERG